MKQKRLPGVNFHRLWQESGEVLSENSNRLTLILGIMVALSPMPIYRALTVLGRSAAWSSLVGSVWFSKGIPMLLMFALTLFFSLPLFVGLLRMAGEMEAGREVLLRDVLWAFEDKRAYRIALGVSFSVLWRLLPLCGAESLLFRWLLSLTENAVTVLLLGIPLAVFVFVLWYLVAMRSFLLPFLALSAPQYPERIQPYSRSAATHYGMGFFPWIVLSFLTLGILLLADTLPRMLIAYFRLCNYIERNYHPIGGNINE